LEWVRLVYERDESWQSLTDAEREIVLALGHDGADKPRTTAAIDRYIRIGDELDVVYFERLRPGEQAKTRRALDELRGWLGGR
jgi:hypothetical protein